MHMVQGLSSTPCWCGCARSSGKLYVARQPTSYLLHIFLYIFIFLRAAHLTRTRHGYQVCALALSKLQQDAFLSSETLHDEEKIQAWRQKMVEKSPTFQFWDSVLRMEIIGLIFVRAHREANFPLYVETLHSLVRYMESLPPSILEEFQAHGHGYLP